MWYDVAEVMREMGIGAKIEELAKQQKISLKELSRRADIPYTTLYHMVKRDSNRVSIDTLEKIARVFDVEWEDVFLCDENTPRTLPEAQEKHKRELNRSVMRPVVEELISQLLRGKIYNTAMYELHNGLHVFRPCYTIQKDGIQKILANSDIDVITDIITATLSSAIDSLAKDEEQAKKGEKIALDEMIESFEFMGADGAKFFQAMDKHFELMKFDRKLLVNAADSDPAGDDSEENTSVEKA